MKDKRTCKDIADFEFSVETNNKTKKDKRACKDVADFYVNAEINIQAMKI